MNEILEPHVIFIADLHLLAAAPRKTKNFIKFLAEIASQADALYILGDFFDIWLGDDDQNEFITIIKQALRNHTVQHAVYLLPGNRDFLLGKQFAKDTGVKLLYDPTLIDLYGNPTLLLHGNKECSNSLIHNIYLKVVYNQLFQRLFTNLLPLMFRQKLANKMRKISVEANRKKTSTIKKLNREKVLALKNKYHPTQLIYGHLHLSNQYQELGINCFSLPAWDDEATPYLYISATQQEFA
ncbi:MAG: UDP-2,3-diacylglucosamine diphosphatase [Gammaproteobacteria bacterium]|nr:UDP-2,3-diacylglucosamine diphosphatase [Gammaproteobacteria bacterium]